MRMGWALSIAVALACGCHAPSSEPVAACRSIPKTATLRAHVVELPAGTPVRGVEVLTNLWAGWTHDDGWACVDNIDSGVHRIVAHRLGYFSDSLRMRLHAGHVALISLGLRRKPQPCCSLRGAWEARLVIDTPSHYDSMPVSRTAVGPIVFTQRVPNSNSRLYDPHDPLVRYEFGRTAIDFNPHAPNPEARHVFRNQDWSIPSLRFEVVGYLEGRDSVFLRTLPRITPGGSWLWGRLEGDSIMGRWRSDVHCYTRDPRCHGALGSFVMRRTPWTRLADSMVTWAVTEQSAEARSYEAHERARPLGEGELRVRTYDETGRRYVRAVYNVFRGTGPRWDYAFSEDSGWGWSHPIAAGRYSLRLLSFGCGKDEYFADSTYVMTAMPTLEVAISVGGRSQVDARIDSRAIRTKASPDNLRGLSCTR